MSFHRIKKAAHWLSHLRHSLKLPCDGCDNGSVIPPHGAARKLRFLMPDSIRSSRHPSSP
jgi:hypothetical protein